MTSVYCDGLGVSPLQLLSACLRSPGAIPAWAPGATREVIYTHQARNAIARLCEMLPVQAGDEVLAPAYNCGAEIDPFVRSGARVVLYDVGPQLAFDLGRVLGAVTRATRIVYVTHFFGFPQPLEELAAECAKRRILVVEDCAQALFSGAPDRPVGGTGDAAVFSFVKILPVPDGGALVIDRRRITGRVRWTSPPARHTIRASLTLVKRWVLNSAPDSAAGARLKSALFVRAGGTTAATGGQAFPPMLASNYFIPRQARWTMSGISRGLLRSADAPAITDSRRQNFEFLSRALASVPGFDPVFRSLPDGVSPMAFPFVVSDRAYWYERLTARGILVQGWPGYYPGFDWTLYPGACALKDRLLTLPVHHGLTLTHMAHVADSVLDIGRHARPAVPC